MATKTKADHRFTEEEKNFLRDNINRFTYPQLADAFNAEFGTSLTHGNISDVCIKRLDLKRNKPHTFPKGKREFNAVPIGTEMFDGATLWLKIDDAYHEGTSVSKGADSNWARKSTWVYEQKHGKIAEGFLIVHLDMDKFNCSPENLYCVSRKVNFMMAKNGWYKQDSELTLTAIKWCELFYATKNMHLGMTSE